MIRKIIKSVLKISHLYDSMTKSFHLQKAFNLNDQAAITEKHLIGAEIFYTTKEITDDFDARRFAQDALWHIVETLYICRHSDKNSFVVPLKKGDKIRFIKNTLIEHLNKIPSKRDVFTLEFTRENNKLVGKLKEKKFK